MTWNVEGYEPINPEEAIPQLAFVAFNMMKDGVQRISSKRLGVSDWICSGTDARNTGVHQAQRS